MEELHQDFKDFLSLLNSHKVSYLLVGGYAVAIHGHPRYTGDIDIWISISKKDAQRIVAALRDFGFDLRTNKAASGRAKDLADLESLPESKS